MKASGFVDTEEVGTGYLDEYYVEKKLKEVEYLLTYLAQKKTNEIPVYFRRRVSTLTEQFNQLSVVWVSPNKYDTVDDALWGDNFLMKYLFKDFVRMKTVSLADKEVQKRIGCDLCNVNFACRPLNLMLHLKSVNHIKNYDKVRRKVAYNELFWGDNHLLKFLFEEYVFRIDGKLICKICGVEVLDELIVDHLKSLKHMKDFSKIIDITNNQQELEFEYEDVLYSLEPEKEDKDTNKFGSELALGTLAVFLERHNEIKSFNKYIPIFCQLCCSYKLTIDLNGVPDITTHLESSDHMSAVLTVDKTLLKKFESRYCSCCVAYFYCTCMFYKYHFVSHLICNKPVKDVAEESKSCVGSLDSVVGIAKEIEELKRVETTLSILSDGDPDFELNVAFFTEQLSGLINTFPRAPTGGTYFGLFCYPCSYWCTDIIQWTRHVTRNELHKYFCNVKPSYSMKICECFVIIVGDRKFFKYHSASNEHAKLCSLLALETQPVTVTFNGRNKKSISNRDAMVMWKDSSSVSSVGSSEEKFDEISSKHLNTTETHKKIHFETFPTVGLNNDDVFKPWISNIDSNDFTCESNSSSKLWPDEMPA